MSSTRGRTFVAQLMASRAAVRLLSLLPVPLWVVRTVLRRDDAAENRKDSWSRLRHADEAARYVAVRELVERYAPDGSVLDVGCSQGILQEGLRYGRYLGVDHAAASVAIASAKADERTRFVCADAAGYVPDAPPDVVVFNEVIYYLTDPVATVLHHAAQLAPGGVVVVSVFARTWSSRRLMRRLAERLDVVERRTVVSGHLAWDVAVLRPR